MSKGRVFLSGFALYLSTVAVVGVICWLSAFGAILIAERIDGPDFDGGSAIMFIGYAPWVAAIISMLTLSLATFARITIKIRGGDPTLDRTFALKATGFFVVWMVMKEALKKQAYDISSSNLTLCIPAILSVMVYLYFRRFFPASRPEAPADATS